MAATWNTFLLVPLAIGGAAKLTAWVVPPQGAEVVGVRALVGAAPAVDESDPDLAQVNLAPGRDPDFEAVGWTLPAADAQVVSWFVNLSPGGWQAGPVVTGVDLRKSFTTDINDTLVWFIERLRGLEVVSPLPTPNGRRFEFVNAYPRNVNGLPLGSVLVNSITPTPGPLDDLLWSDGQDVGDLGVYGRMHHVQLSCRAWFATPEDRIRGFDWLVQHIPLIAHVAPLAGLHEPTWRAHQEEDFESYGEPTFIAEATFEADVLCTFSSSIRTGFGQVTVAQA